MKLVVDVEKAREVVGAKLSPREWGVFLKTLERGKQRDMAREWGITQGAVGIAKMNILAKLGLYDSIELWVFAVRAGIVKVG